MLGLSEEAFSDIVETVEMTGEQVRRRFIRYRDIAEVDVVGPPDLPGSTIADAQSPVGNFSIAGGTTIATTYGSNVVAGNLLVATVAWNSAAQTCAVAGSLNGAFTAIAGSLQTNATSGVSAQVFFKIATSSGAETITATCSGSNTTRELVIYELSGASSTGQPDSSGGGSGNSTDPTSAITTVSSPGRVISYALGAAGTITAGPGYNASVAQNGDVGEYRAYEGVGSMSVPYADASLSQWVITAAAFHDPQPAAPVVIQSRRRLFLVGGEVPFRLG